MSSGYQVKIIGLEELLRSFARFPQISEKHNRTAMQKAVITVESNVKPLTPVGVSGRLRNSIASEVRGGGSKIVGAIGSTLRSEEYPAVMEFGRRPGAAMPPYGPGSQLARWVHLVLGDAVSVFQVARGIARKGIRGKFYLKNGFEKSRSAIMGYFQAGLRAMVEDLRRGR